MRWPPPVLARFAPVPVSSYRAPAPPGVAGFVQPLTGVGSVAPVPINQQVGGQAFLSHLGLAASVLGAGVHVTRAWAPGGRVGRALFGGGRLGLEPVHGGFDPVVVGAFTLEEDLDALPGPVLGTWRLGLAALRAPAVPVVTEAPSGDFDGPGEADLNLYTLAVLGAWRLGYGSLGRDGNSA